MSSPSMTANGSVPTASRDIRMAWPEAERFLLADIRHVDHVRDLAHFVELIDSFPRSSSTRSSSYETSK